jgi:hypothetical protein
MKRVFLVWIVMVSCHYLSAGIVVTGDSSTAPKAFTQNISAQTYDRKTGTFFVGLEASATENLFTISKAARPTFSTTPSFSSVLKTGSALGTETIEFLKFSPQSSGFGVLTAVAKESTEFSATAVTSLFTDGNGEIASSDLNDASGIAVTDGIVQIEVDDNNIYAAVSPNGSFFGDSDSGIALIGLGVSGSTISLDIKDATTGNAGNKAAPLNRGSTVVKGTSGGTDVVFTSTFAALHWDQDLERLFIGLHIQSNNLATDIAKAVVVGRLDSGVLNFQAIAPDSAITGGSTDEIVVGQGRDITFSPNHLRVMHTSTGPDYLIVDCSATVTCDCTFTTTCNRVFALPLVNDTTDPTDATNGTIADKSSALNTTTKKFTDPATAVGELPENNEITDPEAVVGAGDLPIEDGEMISDMEVVDDAVYVSISRSPDSANDSGIWVSQALFDDTGKIIRWTPWTAKRMIPLNAFPGITLPGGSTHSGSIKFFEVDGKTGNVWFVEDDTEKTVGITSWSTGIQSTDLITTLRSALSSSSYAVLDLNQSTRGFLDTTAQRYALFGGVKKVIFVRTATATDLSNPSSPQTAITDYSSDENFRSTDLPSDAGCCNVLEYTRTSTTADNDDTRTDVSYFFAGTEKGLYVFSEILDDSGFNPIDLSTLDADPFPLFSWKKVENILGSVVDIKTSGAGSTLYVVTSETSPTQPFSSTIFSIPFAATTTTMFDAANIRTIAQTGVGILKDTLQFYGIQIVATDAPRAANPENKEQLILATNQGLFRSNASQAGSASVATATTQAAANWELIVKNSLNTTAKTMFNGIGGMDTPVRQTTWPFSVQDQSGFNTFDRGSIHQYSGLGDSAGTDTDFATFFDPEQFNANSSLSAFKTLDPINYFFSDGGRRFFIFNRTFDPADQSKLAVIPYDVADWNITTPDILNDPTVANVRRFYWVRSIGPTGIVLAGTNKGVVGLQ